MTIIPKTQSIKYAGSKLKLLPYIYESLPKDRNLKILDGFSGSTRVSQFFANAGHQVISNDISEWSRVISTCFLKNTHPNSHYEKMISHLNSLLGKYGWFSQNYGAQEISKEYKKPFQLKNTLRVDSIRDELDKMNLSDIEFCTLLTSLIFALDSVDNTLGHYCSYLSAWSSRSFRDLELKVPTYQIFDKNHEVIQGDIFSILNNRERNFDFAYYDPPYGSKNLKMPSSRVRYSAYYHIWTSLIKNDKPELFGKAKRREDTRDTYGVSVFEEYKDSLAINALEDLIAKTNSQFILLSYSSGGKILRKEIVEILCSYGNLKKVLDIKHKKNVMSAMKSTCEWIDENEEEHNEYLFLLEK